MDADQLRAAQAPLKHRYRADPAAAMVTLRAQGDLGSREVSCSVQTGRALVAAGLHPASWPGARVGVRSRKVRCGDGTVAATYTYDAWGTGLSVTGTTGVASRNSYRWAGGYLDGTGLYHFGQRFYQPAGGRWSQQDSIERPGDPTQGNRYAYTGADPVNYTDPSGLFSLSKFVQGVGASIVAVGSGILAVSLSPACTTVVLCAPTIIAGETAIVSAEAAAGFFAEAF